MTAACSISGFSGWTSAFGGSTAAILSSGRAGSGRRILLAPLRLVGVFLGGFGGGCRLLFGLLLASRAVAKLFELA